MRRNLAVKVLIGAMLVYLTASCGGGGGAVLAGLPAPTGVVVTIGNGQLTLTWNAVTGATTYHIYWRTTPGVTKQNGTKLSNVASPFVHAGLANGTPYYYVVTAANAGGESSESSEVNATPRTALNPTIDTQLNGGNYIYSSVNIPVGVTVTLLGDTVFNVTGDLNIAGNLIADCFGIQLLTQGNITITGSVNNKCSGDDTDAGNLLIQTQGGIVHLGDIPNDITTQINTSGNFKVTDAPDLQDWEFDVLPFQRSATPLPPVCSARSSPIWSSALPGFPAEVRFFGEAADPDGGPVSYQWDFGNGGASTEKRPGQIYFSDGIYNVTMTATDDDGQTCGATLRLVLDEGGTNNRASPGVWAEPAILVVEAGQEAPFSSSAVDPQGQDLSYNWDFGDGSTSAEVNPAHTYVSAGRYPVTLSVTDSDGNTSSAASFVYAYISPASQSFLPSDAQSVCDNPPGDFHMIKMGFDGGGKAGPGRDGSRASFQYFRGFTVVKGGTFKTQDGGDGEDKTGVGSVAGGSGGHGGDLEFIVGDSLWVCATTSGGSGSSEPLFATGDGGEGGNATATQPAPGDAGARGGPGGRAGKFRMEAAFLHFYSPFPGGVSVLLQPGNGGNGGYASASGGDGADGCPAGQKGAMSSAQGGDGGKVEVLIRSVGETFPQYILLKGGKGGKGGSALSLGGKGGDANCPGTATGGSGGYTSGHGGRGGDAILLQDATGITNFEPGQSNMEGGDGGNVGTTGFSSYIGAIPGHGGNAIATASGPCQSANALGGKPGNVTAQGGDGGKGSVKSGKGGDAIAWGGRGGHAAATGGDCTACGNGGYADSVAGDAGFSAAYYGKPGDSGGPNAYAEAIGRSGGNGTAIGGRGGDCPTCPGGKGGDGGNASAKSGTGGNAYGNGSRTGGDPGNATATGGRGGNGANCCLKFNPLQGGDGGTGGSGTSEAGRQGDPPAASYGANKEKGGDGGTGGDGQPPGGPGNPGPGTGTPVDIPDGNPGDPGNVCPIPPPTLLFHRNQGLILYDITQQIETTIQPQAYFERGYCFSSDGARILASKWRNTSWDLVWMTLDGSDTVVAGDPNVDEIEPRCPRDNDGTRFFYISETRTRDPLQTLLASDIYRLDHNPVADTWQSTNLTNDADLQHYTFDVKPDGTEVAYTLYSPNATPSPCPSFQMAFDGTNKRAIPYALPGDVFMNGCPAPMHLSWSRDGTLIHIGDSGSRWVGDPPIQETYFVSVIAAGGTSWTVVANPSDPQWPQFAPPWNDRTFTAKPGGGIIFSNFACESNPPRLGVFTVTGAGWQALRNDLCGYEYDYSADGALVAFTPYPSPSGGIWLMASDGTNRGLISADGERPIFSP